MNKTKKTALLLTSMVFCYSLLAVIIEIPQDVIAGFKTGKAESVSKYFKDSVELTINNNENIYSSTQAELILKDFFKKNQPKDFTIIHEGGKGESKYAIGNLTTANGNYRITLLFKKSGNTTYIHQLRIEKDDV